MKNSKVLFITTTALMTAVICVLAPFSVPIPVSETPITLATFAVYLAACILGFKRGTLAVIIYILIGAAGVPVFSNWGSGLAKLTGPTGGYLIGYIFIAVFTGIASDIVFKCDRKKFPKAGKAVILAVGMIIGTAVCYIIGTFWMKHLLSLSTKAAFASGVIPYIPLDSIKIIVSAVISMAVRSNLEKTEYFKTK